MAWDWDDQRRKTEAAVRDLQENQGVAPGTPIILEIQTVPGPAADLDGYLSALQAAGMAAEQYADEDGETVEIAVAEARFDARTIWQHERAVSEIALAHGFEPDGWGFWEPDTDAAPSLVGHPDFPSGLPRDAELAGHRMTVLGPDDLEPDFEAVTTSADRLRGLFDSDWPDGLTLEANAIDLAWHVKEFELCRSFAWALRKDGAYVGCLYLMPDLGMRGSGASALWLRTGHEAATDAVAAAFRSWLAGMGLDPARYPLRTA